MLPQISLEIYDNIVLCAGPWHYHSPHIKIPKFMSENSQHPCKNLWQFDTSILDEHLITKQIIENNNPNDHLQSRQLV